ncbi:LuxR C-terminal-related transcriptional regulator [Dactylosporangium sp. NPDC050688]|uniref:ATP-binding protein n=1 Tax=Dactylosporangium sp. NPDC050688 TaxID=3157217 RepID=UPI0033F0AA93
MPATPFIGRAEELAEITGAWAALNSRTGPATGAATGPAGGPVPAPAGPRVALVTGEAGSGKSRLVAEVLDRLEPRPPVVLAGTARTLGAAPHDWLASVLSGHPVDGGVPPELAQRSPAPGAGTRLAPAAMLRAAVDVVRALLDGRCGVLVVEDLHDLDPASLTLIGELAATAALPALLLVTSRPPQEAAFAPAAARTLRRLGGAPSVVRAHLAPFDARETAELVEAHRGGAPAPETVRALLTRTGGNPFWLTELVTARGDLAGAPLPAHVAGLLVEPLAGEPALVGRVARAAALLGDPVETDVLVHVCEGEIEPALRRLLDLGMLVLAPDLAPAGPLRFRHPLLREALARSALPSERARVHGLARALAVELGDDAALARHAAALGRLEEASAAAVRGAQASLAAGLPDAALDLVDLGLRAAGPGAAPTGRELARVGAVAAFVAGRFTVAERHAADWLRQAADAVETSDAHRLLAEILWCLADRPGHRTALADARAALTTADARAALTAGEAGAALTAGGADGGGIAAAWARQQAAEAASALRTQAPDQVVPLAEAALVAAEQTGESIASAGVTLGTALAFAGAHDRGVALLHACRQIAEHDRDPVTVGRAVNNLVAVGLPRLGDVTGRRLFDEAMTAIGRSGLEFCAGRTTALGVAHALRTGDLARAETLVWSRLPIETDPLERVRFAASAGLLAVERGDDPLAVRMLARADGEGRDVGLIRVLRVAVAARGLHPLDPALALAECVGRCRPARLVEAARWALHGGVPAATVEDLVGDAVGAAPQLRLLLAVAAGRDAAAVELLPAALRQGGGPAGADTGTVEVVEAAPYDAAVHTAAAHALLRLGRAADARQHAERAVALLVHWPGWRLAEAETLLHSLRAGGDLTAREIEVLGCLAAGMSNQQVASSLGISIRTVTVHVSNLLRKTGAASRTEAALWAVRHRVITPT